jgi:SOS response regulatory protein OraA/RecX
VAVIEAFKEGAHGIVSVTVAGGSLFRFRKLYLERAAEYGPSDADEAPDTYEGVHPAAPSGPAGLCVGAALPEGLLGRAAEAQEAEDRAGALLARAEQYRAGLERKLMAKKFSRGAIGLALDYLEERGLLSDRRYAQAWIRQRMRRHAEGPLSVKAALAARGLSREALALAIAAEFSEEQRLELLGRARELLGGLAGDELRRALKGLGWKGAEIDELFELS